MHQQVDYALAHPWFDPYRDHTPQHFWWAERLITAGLTVNIGME
jgi:hypothetical protein